MCGIAGIYEKGGTGNEPLMDQMLDVIAHRGPDAKTQCTHDDVVLGHRRLSIIDLATGDQPMYSQDRSLCLIFNGEIYNFKELRKELEIEGCKFSTSSDTEVVIQGYRVWGKAMFPRLNGIFAFALYDIPKRTLILVRDHFGIKPMHYFQKGELFVFGSEQKAMIQHPEISVQLNPRALHIHLNLRYTQGNETLFEGIKRLPPASYMIVSDGRITEIKKYWSLKTKINRGISEQDAIEGLHEKLLEAVRRQLISDVPVGVYLSGGLDSSTIVQKMHELGVSEINTFTLGFNEPTDEFSDARRIADHFGTNHKELSLSLKPLDEYAKVIWHAEEPKINLLQGYNMSRFVHGDITVALGGLGGDEVLAGYDIHKFIYPFNKWHRRMPNGLKKLSDWKSKFVYRLQTATGQMKWDEYRRGVQMLLAIGQIEKFYLILRNTWDFDNPVYKRIYAPEYLERIRDEVPKTHKYFDKLFDDVKHLSPIDQVLHVEIESKMVNDYLLVEDRMSMSHSIEERVPFLDIDLVEYALSIPIELKIRNNKTKYLFRKAMEGKLPPKIITKKKWGFTVNPYIQFKKDLRNEADQCLTRAYISDQGIFNYDYLRRIMDSKPHPRMRWHYNFLWVVLGLRHWEKLFIEQNGKPLNS